ncbi:MAG: S41 family peptidase [Campylobacterales bacterium]
MKDRGIKIFGFVLSFLALFAVVAGLNANEADQSQDRVESLTKFTKVINIVEKYYVDDVNISDLVDKSIEGLLSNLDAHSSFLKEKKYKELKIQTSGEFGGLGITVGIKDGALTVISPIEGTPADKAGLEAGDIILKIDNHSTLNMTIDEAVNLMRGKPGTPIELTIVRKSATKPFVKKIIRDIITVESVYTKDVEDHDGILYIRVVSFDRHVVEDVKKALKDKKNLKGVILDLRNNPGGLLDQAVGLTNLFVDEGVIVSQRGRIKNEDKEFLANSKGTIKDIPISVLVNKGSASASEIVSGSLQDHKRAVVVGEETFGKGSVQIILPINNKEALRLTVAEYYLPSGRTIQAVGVIPDIEIAQGKVPADSDSFSVKEAELKKHLEGELEKIEPLPKKEREKEEENKDTVTTENINSDIQLKSALDAIKTWEILNSRR